MAKQQAARMRLCWVAAAVTVLLLLSLPHSSAKTTTVPSRTGVLEGAVQTTVPAEVEKARFGGSDADSRAAIDVSVPVSDAFTQSGHDEASTKLAESGDPPGWSLERVLAVFYTPVETVAASNPAPHIDGRAAQHQLQEDTHVDDNEEDEATEPLGKGRLESDCGCACAYSAKLSTVSTHAHAAPSAELTRAMGCPVLSV